MANVTVDKKAREDSRIKAVGMLLKMTKFEALGRCVAVWDACTIEQVYCLPPLLIDAAAEMEGFAEAMLKAGLVVNQGDGTYRVKGTGGRIEWYGEYKEGAQPGGVARASTAQRGPDGRFLPNSNQPSGPATVQRAGPATVQQRSPAAPASTSPIVPVPVPAPIPSSINSSSSSSSSSSSYSEDAASQIVDNSEGPGENSGASGENQKTGTEGEIGTGTAAGRERLDLGPDTAKIYDANAKLIARRNQIGLGQGSPGS